MSSKAHLHHLRSGLTQLAKNLAWTWQASTSSIFRDLDPDRWLACGRCPHALLAELDDAALDASAPRVGARVDEALAALDSYLAGGGFGETHAGLMRRAPVAYFSAEFGLHESLPIYSGGLGVLAGDHLKSASDLNLPLIGIGLLYRGGYFTQSVDESGWQQEAYPRVVPEEKGLRPATNESGDPVRVAVPWQGGEIHAQVWEANVGRIRLFLLDTDVEGNSAEDRALTANLYGGDQRTRIRQELVLGVGGVLALEALGIEPSVFHVNEGHSAFGALAAVARKMEREGLTFEDACHEVATHTVFTTHTPVPAGHDRFPPELVLEHLTPTGARCGLDEQALLALGRINAEDDSETFCMTVIALRLATRVNGVSYLHGRVSRQMWQSLWPSRARHEVPIGHITNGVHLPSWMAPRMGALLDVHLEKGWRLRQWEAETWAPVNAISDEALWSVRRGLKRDLVADIRRRACAEAEERGESADVIDALAGFDEEPLLIGFARRFATYKRAALLFSDLEALDALVNDAKRPVRIVFAGKAHPRDDGGKKLIQRIHEVSRDPRFLGKVVLLANYDMGLGRALTSGVDVWLNNPRRPLEASGTSGEKVVLNGGLNCSILDGWWAEGYDGANGFAIGDGEVHTDPALQDARDGEALMQVLTQDVAPLFYELREGLPQAWLERVRRSLTTLAWRFNSDRMVRDYAQRAYFPAAGVQLAG